MPANLTDSGLDPSVLHLLDAVGALTLINEGDSPGIVGLVRRYGTGPAIDALSGIVSEHRDGDGDPIRSLPRLFHFAIKEATKR